MGVNFGANPPKPEPAKPVEATAAEPAKKVEAAKASGGELAMILKQIEKDKGDKVCVKASSIPDVLRIATGDFEFDFATGGGFPRGRLSIVYGPESSGKTNIYLRAVATVQSMPGPCNKAVWVDMEHCFDPVWASKMGVDVENLIVVKPGYGEEAVDLIEALIHADDVAIMVIDSIAVLTSAKEVEQSTETSDVGTASLLVKRMANKLAIAFAMEARRGHFPAVCIVNQIRYKIGVPKGQNPETTPGGKTIQFMSSLTVRLYGKNKIVKTIHPTIPAFKETSAIIKKAKVPVCMVEFEYDMAMMAGEGLKIGETDSWNLVSGHLKGLGILSKGEKTGWMLFGQQYPTLIPIQAKYMEDEKFRRRMQNAVIDAHAGTKKLVEGVVI